MTAKGRSTIGLRSDMRRLTMQFCAGALLMAGIACSGDEEPTATEDTSSTTTSAPEPDGPTDIETVGFFNPAEPGTYYVDSDLDESTPVRVTFEITEEGWLGWIGTTKDTGEDGPHVDLTVAELTNVTADACLDQTAADPPVGPTVDDMATALSELAPFEVTEPPTDVTFLGYEGKHLVLTVPDGAGSADAIGFAECQSGELRSWFAKGLDSSYSGYDGPGPGLTEEFWILDVNGTRLAIITNTSADAPAAAVAERQAIFESLQVEA
jgi:hypothetical protein